MKRFQQPIRKLKFISLTFQTHCFDRFSIILYGFYLPVVLMGCKDEEDAKAITKPGEGVEEEDPPGGVLSDKEVKKGEGDSVAREHVVPTCSHTLQTHPCTRPNNVGVV